MQIQVNSDHNIVASQALIAYVGSIVKNELSRFSEHITRVEVHLSDENSDKKGGNDAMRCVMEARLEGRHPMAGTHQAATLDQVVKGAADKLARVIESIIGRINNQRGRRLEQTLGLDEPQE